MKQAQLIPAVELSDEQRDKINENIAYWRSIDDGQDKIDAEKQRMYTVVLDREKEQG